MNREMSEMKIFCDLNFLLIIFGLNISDNFCHNVFKWITRTTTIVYQFYCLISGLYDLTSNPSEMYYYLALEFKRIIASFTYLIILRKRKQLFEFQDIIWLKLDHFERQNTRRLAKYLKYIWISAMIICPVGHLSYESYIPALINNNTNWWYTTLLISKEVAKWMVWSTYNLGWLIAGVSFYSYIIFAYFRLETQLMTRLEKSQNLNIEDIVFYREKYCYLQIMRQEFNKNFGCVPFLWYGELFTATCFRITQFALVETADSRYFITYLYEYLLWAIIQISQALFLGHLSSRRRTQLEIIHLITSKNRRTFEETNQLIIFNQILMSCDTRSDWFEAWNVFVLDRKLIFKFLAAVIPFSVMLIQLSKERKWYIG